MIKIVIINHTFQKKEFYKRWEMLTQLHEDIDITLLAPVAWEWGGNKNLTYGESEVLKAKAVEKERFRIHCIETVDHGHFGWSSEMMKQEVLAASPDFVYFVGEHTQYALMQLLRLKKKHHLKTKVLSFSMRGHQQALELKKTANPLRQVYYFGSYLLHKSKLRYFNKNCDAVFCHYPDAVSEFRREGYQGPVFMQTQVGVDPDIFHPDREAGQKIRDKYQIGDAFLFGSASRFNANKGLTEIIRALPEEGNWKYLVMGWGRPDEVEKVKAEIAARGFEDRVILTGFIDGWEEIAPYWNALDCAIHAPLTSREWEETFSLSLVQAMATGLPVIGSSSGSVPYQIGEGGLIVPERDIAAMHDKMVQVMQDDALRSTVGKRMQERAVNCFGIRHLDELFYRTLKDLQAGVHDPAKEDMAKYDC